MFHFTLNGTKCGCDTIEELQAALPSPKSGPLGVAVKVFSVMPEWLGNAGDELNKLLAGNEEKLAGMKAILSDAKKHDQPTAAVKVAATKALKKNLATSAGVDISKLPLVRGGVTWAVAHKYGKKLGRIDIKQLRSDLFARKKMA